MWRHVTLLIGAIISLSSGYGIETNNTVWPDYHTFYQLNNQGEIVFNTDALHDAWIAFFTEPYASGNQFEILVGGYENTMSYIFENRTNNLASSNYTEFLLNYPYRNFKVTLENKCVIKRNKTVTTEFQITIGRDEGVIFMRASVPHHVDIKYFALASTGSGGSARWLLSDYDEKQRININQTLTSIDTITKYNFPIYENFYPFTNNLLKFRVKAPHNAWIRLTGDKKSFPNYEVLLGGALNRAVYIKRNGIIVDQHDVETLSQNEYRGFSIEITTNQDYYTNPNVNIGVGYEGNDFIIRYVDKHPVFIVKYFSIATTSHLDGLVGQWQFIDMLPLL